MALEDGLEGRFSLSEAATGQCGRSAFARVHARARRVAAAHHALAHALRAELLCRHTPGGGVEPGSMCG